MTRRVSDSMSLFSCHYQTQNLLVYYWNREYNQSWLLQLAGFTDIRMMKNIEHILHLLLLHPRPHYCQFNSCIQHSNSSIYQPWWLVDIIHTWRNLTTIFEYTKKFQTWPRNDWIIERGRGRPDHLPHSKNCYKHSGEK